MTITVQNDYNQKMTRAKKNYNFIMWFDKKK